MKIILATRNFDKVKEIETLLKNLAVEILTLADFPEIPDIIEDGQTLEENAVKKAKTVHDLTGLLALADDTGLEVQALDGRPGVYSSRYSGENATYEDNVNKLLKEMNGIPDNQRNARFRCVISIVDINIQKNVEGICEGRIATQKQGHSGFGYDPIFWVPKYNQTFAEMSLDLKNKISHRGLALQKAKQELIQLLKIKI